MTTIADVARTAGVGVGTASRVLNGSPHVSEATRARVHAAIEQLNYRQTRGGTARSRPRGQVGVLAALDHAGTAARVRAVVRRLQPHGFDAVVMDVDSPARARERIFELPRHPHLAGLVVVSLPLADDEGHQLAQAPFPTIALDTSHPALAGVETDDRGGGRIAAEHLLALGHWRIAVVGGPRRNRFGFAANARREDGVTAALQAAGIRGRLVAKHGPPTRSAAHQLGLELLRLPDRPTAVIAGSDGHAVGVLAAARDLDIAVPGGLSVVGAEDGDLAEHLDLSALRSAATAAGERAADRLLDALSSPGSGPAEPRVDVVGTELISRGTTGPVPDGQRPRRRRAGASA